MSENKKKYEKKDEGKTFENEKGFIEKELSALMEKTLRLEEELYSVMMA